MRRRGFGATLVAVVSAGVLGLTSFMNPAPVHASDIGLIIGGSGTPIPGPDYVDPAYNKFIAPECPTCTKQALFTPEGLYPIYAPPGTGSSAVKQLPFDLSVDQGRQILDLTIEQQVDAGNSVWIYGESQSATISSLVMKDLAAANVPAGKVNFVLVGDPNFPNGGMLARFPGLTLPSMGITFSGATPDNLYPTTIYNQEYDGFADIPQYPLNFISDLNAFLGFQYVHPTYRDLTQQQIDSAIKLKTDGTTSTTYYMIPTANLPLLIPLRAIPVIGNPLADLVQPDLRVLVDLGYGSVNQGWSSGPANVDTPFGLFPKVPVGDIVQALVAGAKQGVQDFVNDIKNPQSSSSQTPTPSVSTSTTSTGGIFTNLVNTVTEVASLGYSTLLPLADIGNALLTTMPAYDVSLFVNSLRQGKILDAVGLPIAADTELLTLAAGFGLVSVLNQGAAIGADISSLFGSLLKASPFAATAPKAAAPAPAAVATVAKAVSASQEASTAPATASAKPTNASSSAAGSSHAASPTHAVAGAVTAKAASAPAAGAAKATSRAHASTGK